MASVQELADEWIAYWRHHAETGKFPDSDVSCEVDRLARDQPETAWEVILAILSRLGSDASDTLVQVLAAGPLEDLLAEHGESFIDRVERKSRVDARFRFLLGGVWQNAMARDVWQRVQRCRNEVW
ncbi:MAG: DUF6869 domain-containing protein [Rhodospirillaceae bacterium]